MALRLKRTDLAGKTGTTNDSHDAWFAGYSPKVAGVAWVGFDQPRKLGDRETGGGLALPIWVNYMGVALKGVPDAPMQPPAGIVKSRRLVLRRDPAGPGHSRRSCVPRTASAPESAASRCASRSSSAARDRGGAGPSGTRTPAAGQDRRGRAALPPRSGRHALPETVWTLPARPSACGPESAGGGGGAPPHRAWRLPSRSRRAASGDDPGLRRRCAVPRGGAPEHRPTCEGIFHWTRGFAPLMRRFFFASIGVCARSPHAGRRAPRVRRRAGGPCGGAASCGLRLAGAVAAEPPDVPRVPPAVEPLPGVAPLSGPGVARLSEPGVAPVEPAFVPARPGVDERASCRRRPRRRRCRPSRRPSCPCCRRGACPGRHRSRSARGAGRRRPAGRAAARGIVAAVAGREGRRGDQRREQQRHAPAAEIGTSGHGGSPRRVRFGNPPVRPRREARPGRRDGEHQHLRAGARHGRRGGARPRRRSAKARARPLGILGVLGTPAAAARCEPRLLVPAGRLAEAAERRGDDRRRPEVAGDERRGGRVRTGDRPVDAQPRHGAVGERERHVGGVATGAQPQQRGARDRAARVDREPRVAEPAPPPTATRRSHPAGRTAPWSRSAPAAATRGTARSSGARGRAACRRRGRAPRRRPARRRTCLLHACRRRAGTAGDDG